MIKFDSYISIIIFVKFLFIIMAITHLYLKATGQKDSDLDKRIVYWKERFEFIFVFLMAILLVYLFDIRHDRTGLIGRHTKLLLYLFGFVLLITAKWALFFKEAEWFKKIQAIIGDTSE
jgi:uncharacterized protein involved in response to NO